MWEMNENEKYTISITLSAEETTYYSEEIMQRKEAGEKNGHVWSIDITGIPVEFIEYNHLKFCMKLWGLNIPKNNSLQIDEKEAIDSMNIKSKDKIWEVGCGGGRIVRYLANYSDNILATDISEEILVNVRNLSLKYVRVHVDNILKTGIREYDFDYIFAFENFFGNFVTKQKRFQGLKNMVMRLSNNGRFVFNYRVMGERSVDQLDIFHDDTSTFGLWHAFTHEEISDLLFQLCNFESIKVYIEKIIHTDYTRPIGGKVSYVILRKMAKS